MVFLLRPNKYEMKPVNRTNDEDVNRVIDVFANLINSIFAIFFSNIKLYTIHAQSERERAREAGNVTASNSEAVK